MYKKAPFFTVIIPTYNRAHIVEKTLNSVINQSYENFEIIIVDNLSQDKTVEVLQPYLEAENIRLIQHDKNYERSKSRNTGMDNARGQFLTFLDSDDLMYETNLEDAYNFIKENPDTRFFRNLFEVIDKDGNLLSYYQSKTINNSLKSIAEGNFIGCIGVFLHKDLYKEVRFDEKRELIGTEDWDFWIRVLAKHPKIDCLEKVNNGVVDHQNRTVRQLQLPKVIFRVQYILDKVKHNKELYKVYKPYYTFMKASANLFLATTSVECKDTKSAIKYLLAALKIDKGLLFNLRTYIIIKNIVIPTTKNN